MIFHDFHYMPKTNPNFPEPKSRCFGRFHRRNLDASPQFVGAILRDAVASPRLAPGARAVGRACDATGGALLYGAAKMG